MILERIELCRIGRFVERVQVGPFDTGLNVLSAPNEHGKSTLMRAAARCLFDRHTTRADELRNLQPAGTDLAPEVVVEFCIAQRKFQLRKRFLQTPGSALAEWREGAWREMAEGDAADQRVFELMMATQPGRGASKPEHWGLLRYLWARQDEPALWPEWNTNSGERIRRCLAKLEVDPGIDRALAGLLDECHSVFTPTGQVKRGGELFTIQQHLEQLDAEQAEARRQIATVEAQQDCYRQLALELGHLRQLVDQSRTEAERLQAQLGTLALTRQEIAAAQEQFDGANLQLQTVDADMQRLAALRKLMDDAGPKQEELRERLKEAATEEDELQSRSRRVEEELAELEQERRRNSEQSARARAIYKWRELETHLAAGRTRLAKIQELSGEMTAKQRERTLIPSLTAKQLESLRALEREVRELEIYLHAAGLQIELAPDNPAHIRAETERGTIDVPAGKDSPAVIHARRRAVINLPGWGVMTITSGAQELRDLEAKLKVANERWAALREKLGAATPEQAEQYFHLGKDLDREIKILDKQLQTFLEGHGSEVAFRNAVASMEARLDGMNRQLEPLQADERSVTLVELDACVANLDTAACALEGRVRRASAQRQDLENQIKDLLRHRGEMQSQAASVKSDLERAVAQAQSLEQRYPTGIESARTAAQQSFVQAEARLAVSKAKLPPEADSLPGRRDRAVRAAAEAEQSYQVKHAEMNRLEGALGMTAAAGLFSRASELDERANCIRMQLTVLRRRGQAARFLCALIHRRKAAAVRMVLGPLEQRLSASFAELTGEQQRSVFLDESLAILGIGRSRDPHELVRFENLSQGAKEQLLLCLRAAAALELAANEPQTLILDDVLVNTDPVRQTRVLDFLTGLAERVQVIVLTCHPERYAGLGRRLAIEPVVAGKD